MISYATTAIVNRGDRSWEKEEKMWKNNTSWARFGELLCSAWKLKSRRIWPLMGHMKSKEGLWKKLKYLCITSFHLT